LKKVKVTNKKICSDKEGNKFKLDFDEHDSHEEHGHSHGNAKCDGHGHSDAKDNGHSHDHEEHGHSHDHEDHGHSHDHEEHGHSHGNAKCDGHGHSDAKDHGHSHDHEDHGHSHDHEDHGHAHDNLNMQAAMAHIIGDLIQGTGAFIGSVIIYLNNDLKIIDPILTMCFAIIVLVTTIPVLKGIMNEFMEVSPI